MCSYRVQAEVAFTDYTFCQVGFDLIVYDGICYPSVKTHVLNRASQKEGRKDVIDYEITIDKIA